MFIVFLIKITSRSSFAVTKKREITKCYPSLDCLYLPVSDSVGIINTYLYIPDYSLFFKYFFNFSEQGNCSVFQLKRRTPSNPVRPAILTAMTDAALSTQISRIPFISLLRNLRQSRLIRNDHNITVELLDRRRNFRS